MKEIRTKPKTASRCLGFRIDLYDLSLSEWKMFHHHVTYHMSSHIFGSKIESSCLDYCTQRKHKDIMCLLVLTLFSGSNNWIVFILTTLSPFQRIHSASLGVHFFGHFLKSKKMLSSLLPNNTFNNNKGGGENHRNPSKQTMAYMRELLGIDGDVNNTSWWASHESGKPSLNDACLNVLLEIARECARCCSTCQPSAKLRRGLDLISNVSSPYLIIINSRGLHFEVLAAIIKMINGFRMKMIYYC
jgi:hypothetical protein